MAWRIRPSSASWLAAGLSILLLAPTAAAGDHARRIGPEIITGASSAPVELSSTTKLIGRLDVPAGRWVLWAHLETVGSWDSLGPLPGPDCTAAAFVPSEPGPHHAHRAAITWYEGNHELSLNSAHTFIGDGGSWRLRCKGHDADVRRVRMVAVRVGELRRQSLVDGTTTSVAGAGRPLVVHGARDAPLVLPEDGWVTVGRLDLTDGPWWITATMGVSGAFDVTCRLRVGPPGTLSTELDAATISDNGAAALTIALDGASVVPSVGHGAPARVECRSAYEGASVLRIRLTAMRLGALSTSSAGPTIGSGWPQVFHRTLAGPRTLGSPVFLVGIHLPAGAWVYSGKVDLEGFEDDIGTAGTFVDSETCGVTPSARVVSGTTRGVFMPGFANLAVLGMARLDAKTVVGMRCVDHSGGGTVFHPHEVRRVQLTALRAGSLTVVPLD